MDANGREFFWGAAAPLGLRELGRVLEITWHWIR